MSDEEDAVEALLDELAEAPPDDALDAEGKPNVEDLEKLFLSLS